MSNVETKLQCRTKGQRNKKAQTDNERENDRAVKMNVRVTCLQIAEMRDISCAIHSACERDALTLEDLIPSHSMNHQESVAHRVRR
jgi:hypothetical protein